MAFAAAIPKKEYFFVDGLGYPHVHLITVSNAGGVKNTPAATNTALQLQSDLYQFLSNHVALSQGVLPGSLRSSAAFQVATFQWKAA